MRYGDETWGLGGFLRPSLHIKRCQLNLLVGWVNFAPNSVIDAQDRSTRKLSLIWDGRFEPIPRAVEA